jgi:hypothetical protein
VHRAWVAPHFGIVVHDYDSIARRMDVELDGVCPQLQRFQERWDRVFGKGIVRAAM